MKEKEMKEFCDSVHMEIHALRRIKGYKPNPSEINLSRLVLKNFSEECNECKEISQSLKENKSDKRGFFSNLMEAID
jgi:hypothetical protein